MAEEKAKEESVKVRKSSGNGLLLYYSYHSFYSQKVLLALNEKRLKFKTCSVDLSKGEQFKPYFMKLNPKGEVPVLKDGVKIIPESARILDYLEDNFSNGDTPRLTPEKGSNEAQKVKEMRKLLETVPSPILTFGAVHFPELTINSKMSFLEKKYRSEFYPRAMKQLDDNIAKYPEFKENYVAKKEKLKLLSESSQDLSYVKKNLDDLEGALDTVEKELASHSEDKENWWLCSENYTVADIILIVLLHRLEHIGFSQRCFGDDKRPHIAKYYERAKQRESFKKTFCQCPGLLSVIPGGKKMAVTLTGAVIVVGLAVAAAFVYRKVK